MVRFQNASGGFYADAEGFLFPLQQRHTVRVPIVDGALPIKLDKNFKGEPQTEQEKEWVLSVLDLVRWLDARKEWNDLVGQISVRKDGNLVLVPREGAPPTSMPSSDASASTTKASPRPGKTRTRPWTCALTAR